LIRLLWMEWWTSLQTSETKVAKIKKCTHGSLSPGDVDSTVKSGLYGGRDLTTKCNLVQGRGRWSWQRRPMSLTNLPRLSPRSGSDNWGGDTLKTDYKTKRVNIYYYRCNDKTAVYQRCKSSCVALPSSNSLNVFTESDSKLLICHRVKEKR
jgi:hypothetical protein